MSSDTTAAVAPVVAQEQLLAHWQGHRRLTRRAIEVYPEDKLFSFSIGSMRTFGELALEMIAMDAPMIEELTLTEPREYKPPKAGNKTELLRLWDENTRKLDTLFPQLPPESFQETRTVFGQYTSPVYDLIWYVIDNEIHHRGQGYVYMRALAVEPPPFWVRD
jgi:uncharacterized damage-inducible protein DinB